MGENPLSIHRHLYSFGPNHGNILKLTHLLSVRLVAVPIEQIGHNVLQQLLALHLEQQAILFVLTALPERIATGRRIAGANGRQWGCPPKRIVVVWRRHPEKWIVMGGDWSGDVDEHIGGHRCRNAGHFTGLLGEVRNRDAVQQRRWRRSGARIDDHRRRQRER